MELRNGAPGVPQLNLVKARERRGITLKQISDATKISVRFLQAIESEQFEQLPGGIYGTSYIRQYARNIGVEEAPVLDAYHFKMGIESKPVRKDGASETNLLFKHAAGR